MAEGQRAESCVAHLLLADDAPRAGGRVLMRIVAVVR